MDAAAHRADGYAECLGDLLVRLADDVAQHDGGPEVLGQARPGRPAPGRGGSSAASASSAHGAAGSNSSGGSAMTTAGRRLRRRTSSRNALVVMRLNHPSMDPGR